MNRTADFYIWSFVQTNESLFKKERIWLKKIRLIVKLSFKLTFWIQIEIESSCSHFQLNLSRVAHIFNLTRLNSTENWVNSTRLVKNSSLTSRELNIEKFSVFDFCIIFLHYFFALSFCIIFLHYLLIESYEEEHEDYLIESHKEKHEEKTWRSFDFDRKS